MSHPAIGPFHQVVELAEHLLEENDQATVFQLFECDHCGALQRTEQPDTFDEVAACECGKKTDLTEKGCGCFIVIGDKQEVIQAAFEAACGGKPQGLPS